MNLKKNIPYFNRFKGAPWFEPIAASTIFIGGAGGIGSHLSFLLTRTGARVVTIDNDTVDESNLGGQLYGLSSLGKPKVEALKEVISTLCGHTEFIGLNQVVTPAGDVWKRWMTRAQVVCVGFDNLEARRTVYDFWKKEGQPKSLFVDGRLGFEGGQVFVVDKTASEDTFLAYEATYFTPEEAIPLPCTMKATTHCGSLIASLMVTQITNWFANQTGIKIRDVKNVEYHLPFMVFETPTLKVEQNVTVQS